MKMDDQLIEDLSVQGLKPAHQKRSRDLVAKLLTGGLELLKTHDFDTLSIERLCAHTDVTIGSFYARFDSKDAFVQAMQRLAVEQARDWSKRVHGAGQVPNDSLAHLLAWFVKGIVHWYRMHEGLVRASLRRSASDPAAWTPIRELGQMQLDLMLPRIRAVHGGKPNAARDSAIQFAFQVMNGTLNNMVMINPGPFSIQDPKTSRMLAHTMARLIEDPPNLTALERAISPREGKAGKATKRR